jgi:hypothetical protein
MENKTLPITAYLTGPANVINEVLELLSIDRSGQIKGNQLLGRLIQRGKVRVHHPTVTDPHNAFTLLCNSDQWVTAELLGEYAKCHGSNVHTAGRIIGALRSTIESAQHGVRYNLDTLPAPLRDGLNKVKFRCTEVPWKVDIHAPDLARVMATHADSLIVHTNGFGLISYDLLRGYMIDVCHLDWVFNPTRSTGTGGGDSAGGSA